MRNFVIFVVALGVIQSAISQQATPISFARCIEEEFAQTASCTIDSVAVEGCKDGVDPCKVKRKSNSTMVINFTPDFDSTNNDDLEWMAYALLPGTGTHGTPMPGMDPKACLYMPCPISQGKQTTYRYGMNLPAAYPKGSFSSRFIMKYAGEAKCCFRTKIRVD